MHNVRTSRASTNRRSERDSRVSFSLVTVTLVIASCTLFPVAAKADCGSAAGQAAALRRPMSVHAVIQLADPTPQIDVEDPLSLEEDHEANPQIVGFWKTTFTSDGTVVDVGFDQFHPDGTENSVDSPAPSFGNVCLGVWEKTGRRRYSEVHPDFNWDPVTGKTVSIFVQKVEVTISRDGKSFTGKFTWDSYDFSGKPLADSHIEGTVAGERITVKGGVPFPFPL